MVNFGPLAAEIVSLVWGTQGDINGFRVLAALLHGTLIVGVSQTAAFIRGRHLYSAGRPSRWALAHILVHRAVIIKAEQKCLTMAYTTPFRNNERTWPTDGRTDGQTDFPQRRAAKLGRCAWSHLRIARDDDVETNPARVDDVTSIVFRRLVSKQQPIAWSQVDVCLAHVLCSVGTSSSWSLQL